jgi:hypothetical protein
MQTIKEKISVIMPAYNEASRIVSSIEETAKTFNEFGCGWELLANWLVSGVQRFCLTMLFHYCIFAL